MFKRKNVLTHVLYEEKTLYEAFNKLAVARNGASILQLTWAKGEENPHFLSLFGRLAEINWIWSEVIRQEADKQKAFSKVFKDIHLEERVVEEAKKALQGCAARVAKLQKQLEGAKKKNDVTKVSTLEVELATQNTLFDHLSSSIEAKTERLELYKLDLVRKGVHTHAEGLLVTVKMTQALLRTQMQLAELLPGSHDVSPEEVKQQMNSAVSSLSDSLNIHPPSNGGIDIKKLSRVSPTLSPVINRRSLIDLPLSKTMMDRSESQATLSSNQRFYPPPKEEPIHHLADPDTCQEYKYDYAAIEDSDAEARHQKGVRTRSDYAEIDDEDDSEALYAEARHQKGVRMRRTQSGTDPPSAEHRQKHLSIVSFDQHDEAMLLEGGHISPESDTESASLSSSGDLCSEEQDHGYATVGRKLEGSQDLEEPGYANPIDALQEFFESNQKPLQSEDERTESPYQSMEEIRRLRELQQREDVGPGYHRIVADVEDNPGYSRPFDALLSIIEPLKVTTECSRKSLNVSPLPWQRLASPAEKPPRSGTMKHPHPSEPDKKISEDTSLERKKTLIEDRLNFNGSPITTIKREEARHRSRSDGPTPEEVQHHSQDRGTEGGSPPNLERSKLLAREAEIKWKKMERAWSDSTIKPKTSPKPVHIRKMRSGQALVMPNSDVHTCKKHSTS